MLGVKLLYKKSEIKGEITFYSNNQYSIIAKVTVLTTGYFQTHIVSGTINTSDTLETNML